MRYRRRWLRAAVLVVLAAGLVGPAAVPGSAQAATGERITAYSITVRPDPDGRLQVTEVIHYLFTERRHGIYRSIPVRRRYDGHHDQLYRVSDVAVERNGRAEPTVRDDERSSTVIQIGSSSAQVDGAQTYTIRYQLAGALPKIDGRPEVYVNAIGSGWDIPISNVSVRLEGVAADARKPRCYAGDLNSTTPCQDVHVAGSTATFREDSLAPHQGLSVVAQLPAAQATNGPILTERDDFGYRMARDAWVWIAAAVIFAIMLLCAGFLVWWRGRDRRFAEQVPGLRPASGQETDEEFRPVLVRPDGPVEFVPPAGMRPGTAGMLIRQKTGMRDATATIVDLAVRGHLRIEQEQRQRWRVIRLSRSQEELQDYERALLRKFFRGEREELLLPRMRRTFATAMTNLQAALSAEAVRLGWYPQRPDEVRRRWRRLGVGLTVFGAVAAFVLAASANVGMLGVAVALGGLIMIGAAHWMPARTAEGSAAYAQALGFRRYLRVAEAEQIRDEEREGVFSRYLPYAIAFDEADRWVKTFAAAGVVTAASTGAWYVGTGAFDPGGFATSMGSFTQSVAASGSAGSFASGSGGGASGFGGGGGVGGGAGGGGGGSW